MLVGQPAEERLSGARAMLNDGLYERFPNPDYALAFHVAASGPPSRKILLYVIGDSADMACGEAKAGKRSQGYPQRQGL